MLKRLRLKFVAINMTIVTVMLCVILGLVYSFTKAGIEQESLNMMKNIAVHPPGIMAPDTPGEDVRIPYFVIQIGINGEFIEAEGGYFDLSDQKFLDELVKTTVESPRSFGILHEYKLRYYRFDSQTFHRLVFADISNEQTTLGHLFRICLVVGIFGFLIFLSISVFLSGWAVRPVERAWTQQKQFVADASHELKTPLTVIATNIQLVQSGEFDGSTRIRLLKNIETVTGQMRKLLEQMLFLARADAGEQKTEFQNTDLSQIAEDAVMSFEPVFFENERSLESEIEPGITIMGDHDRLVRLIAIFLDNAVKYSEKNTRTELTLKRTEKGKCRLTVSDHGEPILEEQRQKLFERFYRADDSRSRDGSFGLGLSIAESIVKEHRGKIWAESNEGVNSFHVEL